MSRIIRPPMDRRAALRRALNLLAYLQSTRRWIALTELAARFGCHPRTIRRELDALEDVGAIVLERSSDVERNYRAHVRMRRKVAA